MNADVRFSAYCALNESQRKLTHAQNAVRRTREAQTPEVAQQINRTLRQLAQNDQAVSDALNDVWAEAQSNDDAWIRSGEACPQGMQGLSGARGAAAGMGAAILTRTFLVILAGGIATVLYSWRGVAEQSTGIDLKSDQAKQAAEMWERCNGLAMTPDAVQKCSEDYRLTLSEQTRLITAPPGATGKGAGGYSVTVAVVVLAAGIWLATRD